MNKIKRNLHQQVVEMLGSQIIEGKFDVGATLPTADNLSLELGVSRTVTREAIKVLEEKGLLESRPKAGIQVQPKTNWKLLDADVMKWLYSSSDSAAFWRYLVEVRAIIEPAAAELAAQRATPAEVEQIQAAYDQLETALDDLERYKAADRAYHAAIFNASHNPLLIHLAQTVNIDLDAGRELVGKLAHSLSAILPVHQRLLVAIRDHDSAQAYQNALELVQQVATFMEEALNQN